MAYANVLTLPGPSRQVKSLCILVPAATNPYMLLKHMSCTINIAKEASRGDHAPAGEGYLAKEKEKLLYESLNYEDLHNTVHRAERASSTSMDGIAYLTSRWGICLLIGPTSAPVCEGKPTHANAPAGVITGIAAFAVNVSVENISGFKFWATLSLMNKGHIALSFLVYFSISTVLVFCAVALTAYVGPAAAGSGIAEVKVRCCISGSRCCRSAQDCCRGLKVLAAARRQQHRRGQGALVPDVLT
eukprot:1159035-Pelagomonas_calceolata.AAC.5